MKNAVYVRCDAGTQLGMGHLVRCLSLSHMLRHYFQVQFIVQETDSTAYEWILTNGFTYLTLPRNIEYETDCEQLILLLEKNAKHGDVVVLDGYHFQSSYQKNLMDAGYKVAAIDDLHNWHHEANLVVNHAPGIDNNNYSIAENTRLLLGSSYALLRPEILRASRTMREIHPVESVLISMGASDTDNCTLFFAEIIAGNFSDLHLHLLVSSINPHLEALHRFAENHYPNTSLHINLRTSELVSQLQSTSAVICPASSISLESCALGCSIITGYTAENQLGILAGLTSAGAAISLGHFQTLDQETTRKKIEIFFSDLALRREQKKNQRLLIDGKSGLRIALNFLEINRSASCRKAKPDDAQQVFAWANDPAVRSNSFQSEPISWENHVQWYNQALQTPAITMWIYSINHIPAAQMRLNADGNTATISYSVASDFRGKGLGSWLLEHVCILTQLEIPEIEYLQGWVKKANIASFKAFERSGFSIVEELEDRVLFKLPLDTL
jgi:UDP-2,4-diacetamido-2,4,6-trideoxy-beta-L-altropyranose hydrolase